MNPFSIYRSCQSEPVEDLFKRLMRLQVKQGMLIKFFFIACIILLLNLNMAHAQNSPVRGRLEIIKDSRIDSLIAHRYSKGKTGARSSSGGFSSYGYRVQFYSGSNRKEAFGAQNRLQQMHPELRTYINYKEPNFKVKAGDFRSRLEAVKLVQELKGTFTMLLVLSEKINPPKLEPNTPQ
jgi:hypothetical protein